MLRLIKIVELACVAAGYVISCTAFAVVAGAVVLYHLGILQ